MKAVGTGLGTKTADYMRFELKTELHNDGVCNTISGSFVSSPFSSYGQSNK